MYKTPHRLITGKQANLIYELEKELDIPPRKVQYLTEASDYITSLLEYKQELMIKQDQADMLNDPNLQKNLQKE